MPLPGRSQTFAFEHCRDLLDKLRRELGRYQAVAGDDADDPEKLLELVDQLKDSAFNAAVTAWHLADWVFNDMTSNQRQQLGFAKLGDLQNHVRDNCRALYLCRQVATASKHWAVSNHPDPQVQVVVACDDDAGWGAYFEDDGNPIAADQVFARALGFWTDFIYRHNIARASDGISDGQGELARDAEGHGD
jgi:hypothetical protein